MNEILEKFANMHRSPLFAIILTRHLTENIFFVTAGGGRGDMLAFRDMLQNRIVVRK